jgi:hypothetical protein
MRTVLFSICVLVAACGSDNDQGRDSGSANAAGCFATASRALNIGDSGISYSATAYANGPDCNHAAITFVVRDQTAHILLVDAVDARNGLIPDVQSAPELEGHLRQWLAHPNTPATSADFPEWAQGSPETTQMTTDEGGNFFTPEVSRQWYARVRAMAAPTFCYARVQGNLTCCAQIDNSLQKIGAYEHED